MPSSFTVFGHELACLLCLVDIPSNMKIICLSLNKDLVQFTSGNIIA